MKMELKVLEGDYGLPSFDYKCLQLLLIVKMTRQNLTIYENAWKFPQLIKDRKVINNFDEIFKLLSSNIDEKLTRKQLQDRFLLKNIISQSILPATLYLYWIDPDNYQSITAEWFARAKGRFFSMMYLNSYRQKAYEVLKTQFTNDEINNLKTILMQQFGIACRVCATHLQLHQTQFLFGDTPTSIDILLYGYLAPIIKVPFPSNGFAHILRQRQYKLQTLINYVNFITDIYFPEVVPGERFLRVLQINRQRSRVHSNKYLAFTLLFMTIFMTIYGIKYDFFNYCTDEHAIHK